MHKIGEGAGLVFEGWRPQAQGPLSSPAHVCLVQVSVASEAGSTSCTSRVVWCPTGPSTLCVTQSPGRRGRDPCARGHHILPQGQLNRDSPGASPDLPGWVRCCSIHTHNTAARPTDHEIMDMGALSYHHHQGNSWLFFPEKQICFVHENKSIIY